MGKRKNWCVLVCLICVMQIWANVALSAKEFYIITTKDGSSIVVKDYNFTDKYIEFTTENGLPGYIQREEFVKIENMVGVPSAEVEERGELIAREDRIKQIWLLYGALLAILCSALLIYLSSKRKKGDQDTDIYYGRKEKEPKTQGHLSFEYKGAFGRISQWTIDVRSAYEEEGILYVKGRCTTTDKLKIFRADRVVGPVTDLSSEHHAPIGHFFMDSKDTK